MEKKVRTILSCFMALAMVFTFTAHSYAMMGNGNGSNTGNSMNGSQNSNQGMMGGSAMMTNTGGFGMMNGMAGKPVVADDGTAYLVSFNPTNTKKLDSNSFESQMLAVTPSGQITSFTMKGITSAPVISNNTLFATASLPDMNDFQMMGNYGTGQGSNQSFLYSAALPFTTTTTANAVSLDGRFASVPVIANNKIYVVTSDFGNAVMGNNMFSSFKNYNFNKSGQAKSYLYIFNLDLTLVSQTEIQ
jgi:hypothetical protein